VGKEFIVCTIRRTGAKEETKKFQYKSMKQNWNDFDTGRVNSSAEREVLDWNPRIPLLISEEPLLLVLPQDKINVLRNNPLTCSFESRSRRQITSNIIVNEAPSQEDQYTVQIIGKQKDLMVALHGGAVFFPGVKGKAIPLQALIGPEGSRRLRLPDFKTIGT
jgi:hypothetical protein